MADLSALSDIPVGDNIPDELPEQGRGTFLTILPTTLTLRLPSDMMQCWEPIEEKVWLDDARKVPSMGADGKQITIPRIEWNFSKDHPLIIVAPGNPELDEQPCPNVRISNIPRNRARRDQPKVMVAEATFLLRTALGEPGTTPLQTTRQWVLTMAQHAGQTFRVKTGLSAFCNPEKVRYIGVPVAGSTDVDSVEDPSGQKGCGKRYYTPDFKYQGAFYERMYCQKGKGGPAALKDGGCGAYLRGFFTIEEYLAKQ